MEKPRHVVDPVSVDAFPIRQDITVLPADDPKQLRLGWVIYESIGTCVINDYALSSVDFGGPSDEDLFKERVPNWVSRQKDLDMGGLLDSEMER